MAEIKDKNLKYFFKMKYGACERRIKKAPGVYHLGALGL